MKYKQNTLSVIVPVRNEEGNIESIVRKVPNFGKSTELIFIESGSTDKTLKEIVRVKKKYPAKKIILLKLQRRGKAIAVRAGFKKASGDFFIILDGDLTVSPDYLKIFYHTQIKHPDSLIVGNRLFYPMEKEAMRSANILANKFYARLSSFIIGQDLGDALCGMKGISRMNYLKMDKCREFRNDDPFGDFDLIFSAVASGLKIREIPVRYLARQYGKSNINRFKDGWKLLYLLFLGIKYFKFNRI